MGPPTAVREAPMVDRPAIETTALTKRFGSFVAVDRLDLEVRRGEVMGFLGPNGAGKTTTIRMLLGLTRATSGGARVEGFDVWADMIEVHRRAGYVPGELAVWPSLRGVEMLDLLGNLHGGYDRAHRDELCERFEFDPSKKGRTYSRGNRQKIGLIAAFMTRPPLLLLDEPTTGLDPLMEVTFRDCVAEVRDEGRTVFLSSHILSEVERACDRVGILRNGRLVELGTLDELRHLAIRSVEVHFAGPPPDLSRVPGVTGVTREASTVRFELRGQPQPLLDALAHCDVVDFESHEPSLEEVFLTYYGEGRDSA
ncbi:MAG: ABC transporter ATP-binding protein [Acidimicrobiales bacterium]|nr:ABC transporter ATP-binding protein [Acidimicrobiales bacterium]